jgi:DNA-binding response OmpR family regulator
VRIVVVEGDPALRKRVVDFFIENQISAVGASSRQDMMSHLAKVEPDLVILDRLLGTDDGLDLLRDIRSVSEAPGVIITGHRADEIERVIGLELGADDYIAKPFGLRELLARVRAVVRRRAAPPKDRARSVYRFGGWQLNSPRWRLTNPDGAPVPLTKGEYALLVAFLEAPQRPLTRAHLLHMTRTHEDVFDRSVDVQVPRLRRKLESDPSTPRIICPVRGIGYVFDLSTLQ